MYVHLFINQPSLSEATLNVSTDFFVSAAEICLFFVLISWEFRKAIVASWSRCQFVVISFIVCLFRIRQKAFNDICKVFTYLLSSGTDIDSVDNCNQAK